MAYSASVGSNKARSKAGAIGFIGCAADATAHFSGSKRGGTMPHALVVMRGQRFELLNYFIRLFPIRH